MNQNIKLTVELDHKREGICKWTHQEAIGY